MVAEEGAAPCLLPRHPERNLLAPSLTRPAPYGSRTAPCLTPSLVVAVPSSTSHSSPHSQLMTRKAKAFVEG